MQCFGGFDGSYAYKMSYNDLFYRSASNVVNYRGQIRIAALNPVNVNSLIAYDSLY